MLRLIFHINSQIVRLRNTFVNNSLASIKLSKTQLSKMVLLGGFLGKLVGSLAESVFKVGIEAANKDLPMLANKATKC